MHRVALGLGRSVEEVVTTISARELHDWAAFWAVEPWGSQRDNMHAGLIASMLYNVNRGQGDRPRGFEDFMLTADAPSADEVKTQKFVAELRALAKRKKV